MHTVRCIYMHIYFFYGQSTSRGARILNKLSLCCSRLIDRFSNWIYIHSCRDSKIWQICEFLLQSPFFFFSFIVLDSVSQWGILSSGDSVGRVVEDRTQFCLGALLWDYRVVPLPWICSCQQKHHSPGWGSHCSMLLMERSEGIAVATRIHAQSVHIEM